MGAGEIKAVAGSAGCARTVAGLLGVTASEGVEKTFSGSGTGFDPPPNQPKAEEARDVLEVFVDENYGTDWAKWEKAIQDWLKENPDEPAETGTNESTGGRRAVGPNP